MWYPARSVRAEPSLFFVGACHLRVALPVAVVPVPVPVPDPDPELVPEPVLEVEPELDAEPLPELDETLEATGDELESALDPDPPPQPVSMSATTAMPQAVVSDLTTPPSCLECRYRLLPRLEREATPSPRAQRPNRAKFTPIYNSPCLSYSYVYPAAPTEAGEWVSCRPLPTTIRT
jgi:hypothetical protein